jgi:hypothetical protein
MSRLRLMLSALLASFILVSANTFAYTSVSVSFVAPAAREVFYPPVGYERCYYTGAAIVDGIWYPAHRICEYPNSPNGIAYVSGYWGCVSFGPGRSSCSRWSWYGPHWVRPGYRAYGMHHYQPPFNPHHHEMWPHRGGYRPNPHHGGYNPHGGDHHGHH